MLGLRLVHTHLAPVSHSDIYTSRAVTSASPTRPQRSLGMSLEMACRRACCPTRSPTQKRIKIETVPAAWQTAQRSLICPSHPPHRALLGPSNTKPSPSHWRHVIMFPVPTQPLQSARIPRSRSVWFRPEPSQRKQGTILPVQLGQLCCPQMPHGRLMSLSHDRHSGGA